MPFVTIPGLKGLLYVPDGCDNASKKHACDDCYACQGCADTRCSVCREEKPPPGRGGPTKKPIKP